MGARRDTAGGGEKTPEVLSPLSGLVWRKPEEIPEHSRQVLAILGATEPDEDHGYMPTPAYGFAWISAGSWRHPLEGAGMQVVCWSELPDPAAVLEVDPS